MATLQGYEENLALGLKVWIARGSVISIGSAIEFVSRFARTAILSRLLIPSEFGTSVAITVVVGTVALLTDVGVEKFVMVRSDGDRALAAGHTFSVIRGGLVALALMVAAPSIAVFFGVGQYAGSFALVSLYPLIRSFSHLGVIQAQKDHSYFPVTLTQLFAQAAALVAVLPAAYFMRDHRAILVSLIIESSIYCAASHLLARKSYRLQFDREMLVAVLSFGVPLLANGVGLAVFSQFDRILVGHWFGVDTLALYAVILNMTVIPIALIHRTFGTLGLAYISSRMRGTSVLNDDDYPALVFVWGFVAACYALFVTLTLDWITPIVFGSPFRVGPFVHILIVVFSFSQVAKGAPTTLLIATGKTARLSILTLLGGVGLLLAFILIHWFPTFEVVLLSEAVVDLLSYGLFLAATAAWFRSRFAIVIIDCVAAFGSLAALVVSFGLRPELTLGARSTVAGVGLLSLTVQLIQGIRAHRRAATRNRTVLEA